MPIELEQSRNGYNGYILNDVFVAVAMLHKEKRSFSTCCMRQSCQGIISVSFAKQECLLKILINLRDLTRIPTLKIRTKRSSKFYPGFKSPPVNDEIKKFIVIQIYTLWRSRHESFEAKYRPES